MFKEICLKLVKFSFVGVLWVFLLSITVNERPLFSHANELLVQNAAVEFVENQAAEYWTKIKETVTITYGEISGTKIKDF
jgi:hypothetical protein